MENSKTLVAAWRSTPLHTEGHTCEVERYADGTGQVFYNTGGARLAMYTAGTKFDHEPSGHLDTAHFEVTRLA